MAATAAGVVALTEIYLVSDHSVCGGKVASPKFSSCRSHPSSRGGECNLFVSEIPNAVYPYNLNPAIKFDYFSLEEVV